MPAKPYCTTISTAGSPAFTWCNTFHDVRLQIKKGIIAFTDRRFCVEPVTTRLRELDFKLHLYGSAEPAQFRLSTAVATKRQVGHLKIKGSISHLSWPLDWNEIQLDCQVHGQNLDGGQYWPYYQKYVPLRHVGGRVFVDGSYQGDLLGHFTSRGNIVLGDADLDYQRVFADRLPIRRLAISYRFSLGADHNTIDIPEIRIETDDFSFAGSCRLDDVLKGRLGRISAKVSSNQIDLQQIYRYLPVNFIPPHFKRLWQEYNPRGLVKISDAYLNGTYDQIAGIVRQQPLSSTLIGGNLHLSGVSLKAVGVPGYWRNLTGSVAVAGEKIDFTDLHCDMPPFLHQRLNGSLSYWHHEPQLILVDSFSFSLPEEMQLNDDFKAVVAAFLAPRRPKLAAVLADCQQFYGRLTGTLRLNGRLFPEPDLAWKLDGSAKEITLRHPDLGRPLKNITGGFHCSPDFLEFKDFSAIVGASSLTLAGRITDYRKPLQSKLDISLASSSFFPGDFSIIPQLKVKVSAADKTGSRPAAFALKIRGFFHDPASLEVDGQLDVRHVDVSFPWLPRTLDDATLMVDCRGRKIIVRELSFLMGSSDVRLSGDLREEGPLFRVNATLESGNLDFTDFLVPEGQKAAEQFQKKAALLLERSLRNVVSKFVLQWPAVLSVVANRESSSPGSVSERQVPQDKSFPYELPGNSMLRLDTLSFVRGKSDFSLSGQLQTDEQANVHGSLKQTSGQLQTADFISPTAKKIPLWERLEKYRRYLLGQDVSCSSHVDHYVSRNMILDNMDCQAAVSGNFLKIKSLTGSAWEGKIKASSSWDLDQDQFTLVVDLRQINLSQFNQSLTLYSEKSLPLEGTGTVQLNLKWDGNDKVKWYRSLNGQVGFSFVKGRLKRFEALANIASLLNVSQLLTFHLPDLSQGVPYDSLDGSFKVKDGVMQTDDLLLKGPAVNISTLGTISLPERQVDMEVGIQPLQSIDKVIAAVPIVGYIVTGEGKTFIVMRFSVRGPFGKTAVSAIPIRGLVGKTGGILKRLIKTPVRVLSWPGKIFSPAKKRKFQ